MLTKQPGMAAMPATPREQAAGSNLLFLRESELRLAQDLLFFGYRDFTAGPDRLLAELNMGRAHHRVLHFVHRNPGLTIAALLDILKITKQSLNRVLKELIEKGYVEQRAGLTDRRQRLLFPTARGEALALDLARLQTDRITRAIAESGPAVAQAAGQFLRAMIDPADRPAPAAGSSGALPK